MLALADSLGVSKAISYLGNRDDVADLYHACDVTVLTSKREGTPNVLLESMASGVPVVATDVADNATIVPDGRVGYVVAYDDDESMAERVGRLLTDRSARESFGQEARRWVEAEFTLDRLAAQTADVYRRVLARKNGIARQ
jgi:glycosyltransferase involved in cell wall biosynthesis